MQRRVWHFVPELSNGTLQDNITTLNVPLVVSWARCPTASRQFSPAFTYLTGSNVYFALSTTLVQSGLQSHCKIVKKWTLRYQDLLRIDFWRLPRSPVRPWPANARWNLPSIRQVCLVLPGKLKLTWTFSYRFYLWHSWPVKIAKQFRLLRWHL